MYSDPNIINKFLQNSDTRIASAYCGYLETNPNFAKLIRGRLLDRKLNSYTAREFGDIPGIRLDRTVPGSGSRLRPDVYIPNFNGRNVIFDFGGPTKIKNINKFDDLADDLIPIIPISFF